MPPPVIIFSDLDGTLLDHFDYGFEAARPALQRIRTLGVPLVLTTSKTFAEVMALKRRLDNRAPTIVENGGALYFPQAPAATASDQGDGGTADGYRVVRCSPPYEDIRRFLVRERRAHGYRVRGFGDLATHEVAALTGLDDTAAGLARQRAGSEPFLWDDSDERLEQLRRSAASAGLRITRGGRFWHLMGDTDKAHALQVVRAQFAQDAPVTVIAAGDGENDRAMLRCADIAVIIPRPDGSRLDCQGVQRTLVASQPGPAGWNQAMLTLLPAPGRERATPDHPTGN